MSQNRVTKYPKGYEGHDIIDEVVIGNAARNQELYDNACSSPRYFGAVNIGEDQLKLQLLSGKNNITKLSIINDIIYSAENLQLDESDDSSIVMVYGDMGVPHEFHPNIIKFIKSCIACSYNPNADFSLAVSNFVTKFLGSLDNGLTLPIDVTAENDVQKLVVSELNDYLKKICDETGTSYSDVIDVKPKRKTGKSVTDRLNAVVE